ncbi:MAG: hypothetical protein RLZZ600_1264 [Actinomycetota bacterium]|jgi:hypothetical protein
MTTPTQAQLSTDRAISIVLMVLAGAGTLIWAIPSLMLIMASDAGTHGAAWLFAIFIAVAWFGPAAATIASIVWGIIRLKEKKLGTWWRLLIVQLSAPVAIIILGAIWSALPAGN